MPKIIETRHKTLLNSLIKKGRVSYSEKNSEDLIENKKTISPESELSIAELIEEPDIYGVIDSDLDYMNTFSLLFNTTLETEHRKDFFRDHYANKNLQEKHFLEIGCGNCEVTEIIAQNFSIVTLIDNNKYVLDNIPVNLRLNKYELNKIYSSIVDVFLPFESFDTIVLSHVLYYIDLKLWPFILDKVYASLKPGGSIHIVLSSGLDKAKIIDKFRGSVIDLDDFAGMCASSFDEEIFIHDIHEECNLHFRKSFMLVAGFYLKDGNTSASQNEVLNLSEQYHNGTQYTLKFTQRFITINKKDSCKG